MNKVLTRDDPYLLDLTKRYAAMSLFDHSNWESFSDRIDLQRFRGEDAYLSQLNYGMTVEHYQRTFDYMCSRGLYYSMAMLGEDGAFGAVTFTSLPHNTNPNGIVYSRDLLDSVLEIDFLKQHLPVDDYLANATILDIGAGYGRFAHRYAQMFPKSSICCVDAVPVSTFICDYYLGYRGLVRQAWSIPLDMLDTLPKIDIATNMYGFGEMTISAIEFWFKQCAEREVQHIFITPHDYGHTHAALVSHERDGSNIDYTPLFAKYGYNKVVKQFKFPLEQSQQMVFGTQYILLQRG